MEGILQFLKEKDLILSAEKLSEALTHPSILHEKPNMKTYERLETIGDAVLDLLVLDKLNELHPLSDPAFLTKKRSNVVNNVTLATFGKSLNIDHLILRRDDYSLVTKDYSDIVEALFGAIFVDQGYDACKQFLESQWEFLMSSTSAVISSYGENPIGKLQEILQKQGLELPIYTLIAQVGTPHNPLFTMQVLVNLESQQLIERAQANNKQSARVSAAKKLLQNPIFQEYQLEGEGDSH